jgi:hypothetical protein
MAIKEVNVSGLSCINLREYLEKLGQPRSRVFFQTLVPLSAITHSRTRTHAHKLLSAQ